MRDEAETMRLMSGLGLFAWKDILLADVTPGLLQLLQSVTTKNKSKINTGSRPKGTP
jgi:hypothetical protein